MEKKGLLLIVLAIIFITNCQAPPPAQPLIDGWKCIVGPVTPLYYRDYSDPISKREIMYANNSRINSIWIGECNTLQGTSGTYIVWNVEPPKDGRKNISDNNMFLIPEGEKIRQFYDWYNVTIDSAIISHSEYKWAITSGWTPIKSVIEIDEGPVPQMSSSYHKMINEVYNILFGDQ